MLLELHTVALNYTVMSKMLEMHFQRISGH